MGGFPALILTINDCRDCLINMASQHWTRAHQQGSFFKFVMQLKWPSSIRSCSHIWIHTTYESRKNTSILLYPWLSTRSYHKTLEIWIFFLQNLMKLCHVFHEKNLCIGWHHYFQVAIRPQKNTAHQFYPVSSCPFWHFCTSLIHFCTFLATGWLNLITHSLLHQITCKLDTPLQWIISSNLCTLSSYLVQLMHLHVQHSERFG